MQTGRTVVPAELGPDTSQIEVFDDADSSAYVISVDGERAGKAVYHMRGGRHFFVHTEIDDEYSGHGLGTTLVKSALDDVRQSGGAVVPLCPLFAAYIKRHPEYEDLVDHEIMDRVDRAGADGEG